MERKCGNCNGLLQKASLISTGGIVLLEENKKGFKAKVSGVDAYVCSNCGHIELVAEKPEIFSK